MADRHPQFPMMGFSGANLTPQQRLMHTQAAQQRIQQHQLLLQQQRQQQQQQQQNQGHNMDLMGQNPMQQQNDFARSQVAAHLQQGMTPQQALQAFGGAGQPTGGAPHDPGHPFPGGAQPGGGQANPGQAGNATFTFPPGTTPTSLQMMQARMLANGANGNPQAAAAAAAAAAAQMGMPGGDMGRQMAMLNAAARQQQPQGAMNGQITARMQQQIQARAMQLAAAGNPAAAAAAMAAQQGAMFQGVGDQGQTQPNAMQHPIGVSQPGPTGQPAQPGQQRPSLEQLKQFLQTTRNDMQMLEAELKALPATRGERSDADIQQHVSSLRGQLMQKRAHMTKIATYIQNIYGRGALASEQGPSPHVGAQGTPSNPVANGQGWMGSPVISAGGPSSGAPGGFGAHLSPLMQSRPVGQQQVPQQNSFDSNTMLLRPPSRTLPGGGVGVNRMPQPGQPGQQQPGAPGMPMPSPAMRAMTLAEGSRPGQPQAQPGQPGQGMPIVALDRAKFETSFMTFSTSRRVAIDMRTMRIGDHQIDLYMLFMQVRAHGGYAMVEQNDLWPIIGGKLGIVQFPATATTPAKSAPAAANGLAHLYKEYLAAFEDAYVTTVQQRMAGATQLPVLSRPPSAVELQKMLQFANMSVDEMRTRRVPEVIINTVEAHRPTLIQKLREQEAFRAGMGGTLPNAGPTPGQQQPQQQQPPPPPQQQQQQPQQQQQQQQQPGHPQQQPGATGMQIQQSPRIAQNVPGMHTQQNVLGRPMSAQSGSQQGTAPQQSQPQVTPGFLNAGAIPPGASGPPGNLQLQSAFFQAVSQNSMTQQAMLQAFQTRFPQDQMSKMVQMVFMRKQVLITARLTAKTTCDVLDEDRDEYDNLLERLWRITRDLDKKLPLFLMSIADSNKQEDILRKFLPTIATVEHQRNVLISGTSRFFLSPDAMKHLISQMGTWHTGVMHHLNQTMTAHGITPALIHQLRPNILGGHQPQATQLQQPPQQPPGMQPPAIMPHNPMSLGMSQIPQPQQVQQTPQSEAHPHPGAASPANQPATGAQASLVPTPQQRPIALQQPPQRKPRPTLPSQPNAGVSTPTTNASSPIPTSGAPTPLTVAPTPSTSAPSPVAAPTPQAAATVPKSPKATPKPKPRAVKKSSGTPSSPTKVNAPPIPSPTPTASTSLESGHSRTPSVKRPRAEDENTDATANSLTVPAPDAAPSPKRAKLEWDEHQVESLSQHEQRAELIKTDEDATAFFEQMQTLLERVADGESGDQSTLPDISATLGQILQVVGGGNDPDAFSFGALTDAPTLGGVGEASGSNALGNDLPPVDEFAAFFDFASFPDSRELSDSLGAATPELVHSSSTNPSPESATADTPKLAVTKVAMEGKLVATSTIAPTVPMENPVDDLLRLGAIGEIDGGEASYWQNVDGWQWQGSMQPAEWAVMQS